MYLIEGPGSRSIPFRALALPWRCPPRGSSLPRAFALLGADEEVEGMALPAAGEETGPSDSPGAEPASQLDAPAVQQLEEAKRMLVRGSFGAAWVVFARGSI